MASAFRSSTRLILVLGILILCSVSSVRSWSKEGHILTCRIAQNLLEAGPAHVVENLLPDYVKGDLSALCVWPDQIRHWYKYRWTSHLHYIDTPDQACSYEYSSKSQPRHFQITLIRFLIILNRS
jgi:hypothetical protein